MYTVSPPFPFVIGCSDNERKPQNTDLPNVIFEHPVVLCNVTQGFFLPSKWN